VARQRPQRTAVAVVVFAVSILAIAAAFALLVVDMLATAARPEPDLTPRVALPVLALAFTSVGAVLATRPQSRVIGWLFAGVGFAQSIGSLLFEYGVRAQDVAAGTLPAGDVGAWVGDWLPFVMIPAVPVLLLVFPTGRLLSPKWRLWMGLALASGAVFLLADMSSSSHLPAALRSGTTGAVMGFLRGDALGAVGAALTVATILSALASIVVRVRRANSEERHQLKWFAYSGGLVAGVLVLSGVAPLLGRSSAIGALVGILFIGAFASVPASVGVAVLRYRLYDIDVVISRTLVYGALAAFITAVYVGIVVGIGSLVGSGGRPNLVLSIVATAVVAVAFQPVRERLQKIANRLVYGKRATPYEVLSEFSARVAESYAGEQVLPRMAQVLAQGTGAEIAEVWLRSGNSLRAAASWPAGMNGRDSAIELTGQLLPQIPETDLVVPVRHQGELLGALSVQKRAGESLTPIEEKLLDDLAHQAGLVLKNVGLTSDLQARLEDLRSSRQRLVMAQDDERRKLERNLHDGAQQNLVALKVKLGLVEMTLERDPGKTRTLLTQLKAETDEALETLRDLARGIYPPLLADKGLVVALAAQARKATLPVAVESAGLGRYPQEVEAAAYFCVLEALQNIQKYAEATEATVRLSESDGQFSLEVEDDGKGFDPAATKRGSGLQNMSDRLEALGGRVEINSALGLGTTIRATLAVTQPS